MSKMPIANDSRLCNGQTNSKNYNSMNGTLATEQSAEEDMEIDQNGKWLIIISSPNQHK